MRERFGETRFRPRVLLCVALAPLLLVPFSRASAGRPDPYDAARPHFRVFTERDGLVQSTVTSVAMGADGRIWAGTWGGLAVYDGRGFLPVELGGRTPSVRALAAGPDGRVWAGTVDDGLWVLDAGRWSLVPGLPRV